MLRTRMTACFSALLCLTALACSGAAGGGGGPDDGTDAGGGTDGFQAQPDAIGPGTTDTTGTDAVASGGEDATTDTDTGCKRASMRCQNDLVREECDANGEWIATPCGGGEGCYLGFCAPTSCTPGESFKECTGVSGLLVCNEGGTGPTTFECPAGEVCFKGECGNFVCEPGSRTCLGFGGVQQCKADATGYVPIETCEKGGSCVEGTCISACDVDIKTATYRGCEYFAVDLDNIEGGQYQPVAVVVSVPSEVEDAVVSIRDVANNVELGPGQLGVGDMNVVAGTLKIFTLPLGYDIDGSGRSMRSFHVKTSSPATVHQFNPLNGEDVFTNDASLLLPTAAGGTEYYALSWALRNDGSETLRGFVTVVATQEGQTLVTVDTTAAIIKGAEGSGVDGFAAGQNVGFILNQGEVLNLEADGPQGADLTGTRIVSDRRVSVFGGHECANVPLGVAACDHIEQQLLPVGAWGQKAVVDTFAPRSAAQFDIVRVMGGGNDVTVTTLPPVPGYETFMLQRGTYVTFATQTSVEVSADGKILVGHYMIGSSYPGYTKSCPTSGIGDPAMTLTVPTLQYLDDYTVLTPPGYTENYVNVIAPAEAAVTVDGVSVDDKLAPIAGTPWFIGRVPVSAGVHSIAGKKKFGLTAYGYDCDVSYAYPGGLQLKILKNGGN